MKWLLLIFACYSIAFAQMPSGKLYLQTLPTSGQELRRLGYIHYPSQQYVVMDSVSVGDMTIDSEHLIVAEAYQPGTATDIRLYDLDTDEWVDTLTDVAPNQVGVWKDKIVFSAYTPPYFRVYDRSSDSLLFSLDSTRIPAYTADLLVAGDSVYVAHGPNITVIDLNLRDTVKRARFDHPWFSNGTFLWLELAGGDVYANLEYATSALRFTLFRLNRPDLTQDSVQHVEMYANAYPPVAAGDRLYLFGFKSHYSLTGDSIFIDPSFEAIAFEYDENEDVLMVYDQLGFAIETWWNDSITSVVPLPAAATLAQFAPEVSTTGLRSESSIQSIRIAPNPTSDRIRILMQHPLLWTEIRVLDVWGRTVQVFPGSQTSSEIFLDLEHLPAGMYWIQLHTQQTQYQAMIYKQ